MNKFDICIIDDNTGDAGLLVYGKREDGGLLLLQRLYVLMLSNLSDTYRPGSISGDLLAFLEGGNTPDDNTLNALLALSCSSAMNALDTEDRRNVSSFSAKAADGAIEATLKLTDGTTVKGKLQ